MIWMLWISLLAGISANDRRTSDNYDSNGNLNGTSYVNGVQPAYTYNAANRLTNLSVVRYDGQTSNTNTLQSYSYNLDKNGMRTRITELSGRTINHVYDKLLRLTQENITGGYAGDPNGTLSYTYDAVSNRTSRVGSGAITTLLPNQTQNYTANDHLTSDTYDANGNTVSSQGSLGVSPASSQTVTDIYSFDNRLIRRTRADGKVIELTYNADGHRLYKLISQNGLTVKLQHYLTDTNNPTGYAQVIEEKNPLAPEGRELAKVHLYGHDLIATETASLLSSVSTSSVYYYSYDGLGSVRSITNEQGLIHETYDYDAYGNLIGFAKYNATTNALEAQNLADPAFSYANLGSEYLFTGEQWDADLGMVFLRARYMNTGTGRFHSMDTYEGRNGEPLTLHKYLYAHGNPVMFLDPSGNTISLILLSVQNFILNNFVRITASAPVIATSLKLFGKINLVQVTRFYQQVAQASAVNGSRLQSLIQSAQAQYPKLTGFQNHHLIPIQLANRLAELGVKIPSNIANITFRIPNAYHRLITNEINVNFPRGLDAFGKTRAFSVHPGDLQSVLRTLEKIYEKFPLP